MFMIEEEALYLFYMNTIKLMYILLYVGVVAHIDVILLLFITCLYTNRCTVHFVNKYILIS